MENETKDQSDSGWLKKFLNVYWLRPEAAMWRSLNTQVLNTKTKEFTRPSLDLSCGDGINSFLLAGGDFDRSFDVYHGAGNLEEFYDDVDIYDSAPQEYDPTITERPAYKIDVGTDWKPNLLEKADALGLYDELIEHDNNDALPFEDGRFKTVFTNSAYWVDNIDLHLREIRRVLNPEGTAVLQLVSPAIHNLIRALDNQYGDVFGENLISMLDRGRRDNYAHAHFAEGWTNRLERAGLEVVSKEISVSQWHANLNDIGLRPISPYLIQMANGLPRNRREKIKSAWIDTWIDLLEPMHVPGFDPIAEREPPEYIYVVTPS